MPKGQSVDHKEVLLLTYFFSFLLFFFSLPLSHDEVIYEQQKMLLCTLMNNSLSVFPVHKLGYTRSFIRRSTFLWLIHSWLKSQLHSIPIQIFFFGHLSLSILIFLLPPFLSLSTRILIFSLYYHFKCNLNHYISSWCLWRSDS